VTVGSTLRDQLLNLLVCTDCGAPVEFDKADKVYRHKEPLDRHCKKNGYPVVAKVKTK
jgi:hypothetical protein